MTGQTDVKEEKRIESLILTLREQRVIMDHDLAAIYSVSTKRLNEQVKRNRDRFPEDFMFQLNPQEKAKVVANCDHLTKLKSYFNHVTIRDLFPLDTRYSSLGTLPGHEPRVTCLRAPNP